MCWSGGRAPHILIFGAGRSWVVTVTPDHLTRRIWGWLCHSRILAESVSAAVNTFAISRGLSHCLSHCAYSHCREKPCLHASIRLRDAHRATCTVYIPATSELSCRNWGPHDCQSAALLCGSCLYSAVGCTLSGTVRTACLCRSL